MENKPDRKVYKIIENMVIQYYENIRTIRVMKGHIRYYEEQESRSRDKENIKETVKKLTEEIDELEFKNKPVEMALEQLKQIGNKYKDFIELRYGHEQKFSYEQIADRMFVSSSTCVRKNKKALLSLAKYIPEIFINTNTQKNN